MHIGHRDSETQRFKVSLCFGDPKDINMKDRHNRKSREDEDTIRPEYDFSKAVRGVTAARYAQGTNVVLLDPDVAEIFPDTRAVNEALRTFAKLSRASGPRVRTKRTA